MEATAEVDKSLLIEGLGKGLRVIECFSDSHPRLTASETARLAGLTRTAARRYLMSLVHYGYAATDGKHYWLLPAILRLGRSYLEAARLPRLVQPFMQRLSMQTGETANLSVLDGRDVVYLTRSNSPRIVSIGFHPGARVPAHVVSPGFAILSTFSEERLAAWFADAEFGQFTPETITDPQLLRDCVERARRLGYWLADQYADIGLRGLAVPLKDRQGRCVGALSITFQAQVYPGDGSLVKLLPGLQEVAQLLRGVI
ncbi:helix-turn-helix domain-containing protein [Ramlibacter sp. G-1-2-2]|uniref:Helix-turn-helix domain-containing protein n=1 Tax=Ramlibacter agri TaxID=2728837 RepID=A0A848H3L6_9BURK|nr:helix-turn-helix domain-containing protein [Ramlibacter agri]